MPLRNLNEHRSEFPKHPGEQTRTNHRDCPAGEDTKRRLYIQLTPNKPHVFLGYCHNCGEGGVVKTVAKYRQPRHYHPLETVDTTRERCYGIPSTADLMTSDWWCTRDEAGAIAREILTTSQADRISAHYDGSRNRLIYPIYDIVEYGEGKNIPVTTLNYRGYNSRAIYKGDTPKYYRMTPPDFPGLTIYKNNTVEWDDPDTVIVLCEDQISACLIPATFENGVGVCLYGTNHNIEKLHTLMGYFDAEKNQQRFKIWFDNDSKVIKRHAFTTAEYLKMLGAKYVNVVEDHADPKHYIADKRIEILCTTK